MKSSPAFIHHLGEEPDRFVAQKWIRKPGRAFRRVERVEFANQQRAKGLGPLAASVARFRPVLMTSLATMLGILPIALALGAGAESRRSMGIAVLGGLAVGTALTLVVIPAMDTFITSRGRRAVAAADEPTGSVGQVEPVGK